MKTLAFLEFIAASLAGACGWWAALPMFALAAVMWIGANKGENNG